MSVEANPELMRKVAETLQTHHDEIDRLGGLCEEVKDDALIDFAGDASIMVYHTKNTIEKIQATLRQAADNVALADSGKSVPQADQDALDALANELNTYANLSPEDEYRGDNFHNEYDDLHPDPLPGDFYQPTAVTGDLFTDQFGNHRPPEAGDIDQYGIGNCWLLAALGSAVITDPEAVENLITDNGDGTYTVHFADGDVTVTGDLPEANKESAAWVRIIDKAYAVYAGGSYDDLEGDRSERAFNDLFGVNTERHDPDGTWDGLFHNKPVDESIDEIEDALNNNQPVVVSLKGELDIDGGHALIVEDVVIIDGKRWVRIRNPWGESDIFKETLNNGNYKPKEGGAVGDIPEEDFGDIFREVKIADPIP